MLEVETVRPLRILGIAGSLREHSYNRALLEAAREVAPPGVTIEIYERLGDIPPYNEDVRERGEPEPVRALKAKIREADALLIASPEFNYSVPGVLKNAVDWASRPPQDSPLRRKPVAIMGAATGNFGTVRGQLALRQILEGTKSLVMPEPELLVFRAAERFEHDRLIDPETRNMLRALIESLAEWVHTVQPVVRQRVTTERPAQATSPTAP
jgi:chromate reductase